MDFMASEEVIDNMITENQKLCEIIASMQSEPESAEENSTMQSEKTNFSFERKKGKFYSGTIRKQYYNLLANQVPATKIASIVECVIKCFLPNIDLSTLQLPKETCAGCMRREEMATIAIAHKANALCTKITAGEGFQLNSDGTTKIK